MFLYNRDFLLPYINTDEPAELQLQRKQYSYKKLDEFQQNVIKLVNVSRQTDIAQCISLMKSTLNNLCAIAYMQVPLNLSSPQDKFLLNMEQKDLNFISQKDITERFLLPRLRGQANVRLTFRRPKTDGQKKLDERRATITLLVDGINYPYTAGNFIDLCLKKFYENQPVTFEQIDFDNGQIANFTVIGDWIR